MYSRYDWKTNGYTTWNDEELFLELNKKKYFFTHSFIYIFLTGPK